MCPGSSPGGGTDGPGTFHHPSPSRRVVLYGPSRSCCRGIWQTKSSRNLSASRNRVSPVIGSSCLFTTQLPPPLRQASSRSKARSSWRFRSGVENFSIARGSRIATPTFAPMNIALAANISTSVKTNVLTRTADADGFDRAATWSRAAGFHLHPRKIPGVSVEFQLTDRSWQSGLALSI